MSHPQGQTVIIPTVLSLPSDGVNGQVLMMKSKLYFYNGKGWVKLATQTQTPESRWVPQKNPHPK